MDRRERVVGAQQGHCQSETQLNLKSFLRELIQGRACPRCSPLSLSLCPRGWAITAQVAVLNQMTLQSLSPQSSDELCELGTKRSALGSHSYS